MAVSLMSLRMSSIVPIEQGRPLTFQQNIQAVPELAKAYQPGLKALRAVDRALISISQPRSLAGSVNLDKALKKRCPTNSRWDYGIGKRCGNTEEAIWVEVHSANAGHVLEIIHKMQWLQSWLKTNATQLLAITRRMNGYVWLSTGTVSLQQGSWQAKSLAQAGVSFPREHLVL